MPIDINGSGTITGLSVGGLNDGVITPSELSTGAPTWDSQGNVGNITSINSGPLAGFRNAIINGNFDVWQRGTSSSVSGYQTADRWVNSFTGSSCTMSRQAFTLGQTSVPGEPQFYCRMAVTSVAGAGNYALLHQRIEDVRTFAGQQITVSFWAKADASKSVAVDLEHYFGTGGSPSSSTAGIGATKIAIGNTWQKVVVTTTLPSISGKTVGSDSNSFLGLFIWFDAGSNFNSRTNSLGQQSGTFDIAQVQVEAGPVATPFERRPLGTELALCQRYYETGFAFFIGYQATGSGMGYRVPFAVTKRGAPTVAATNAQAGSNLNATPVISGTDSVTPDSFNLYHTVTTNTASFWRDTWTASAEL